jgi:hypothetical protein
VVNRVDGFGFGIFIHEVEPGPVGSSLCVKAPLVLLKLFPAFLLLVPLDFAEIAEFSVLIAVVSAV